jgi:hypothetical protein
VELRTATNEPLYGTNMESISVAGILLDAFQLTQYNGRTIQCSMRDMQLFNENYPERLISINGTFVGAVTFGK